MNLFGWFGSANEESKEEEHDNVTTNNDDEIDLLGIANSFFTRPRSHRRRNVNPDSVATSIIQHHQAEALVLKLREAKR